MTKPFQTNFSRGGSGGGGQSSGSDPKQKAIIMQNAFAHAVNLVVKKAELTNNPDLITTDSIITIAKKLTDVVMKESGL